MTIRAPYPLATALPRFAIAVLLATIAFGSACWKLALAGLGDDLHSYAIAIPFIVTWLIWQNRRELAGRSYQPAVAPALVLALAALAAGLAGVVGWRAGWIQTEGSSLSLQVLGWVLAVWAGAFGCLGTAALRLHAFPWAFLAFTIPLPPPVVDAIEVGLQHASASAVAMVFDVADLTYWRDARSFWLPGLRFEVAQECSGVRSTLVLLITGLLGSYLLLQTPWRRAVVTLSIIPLGIARNTVRICTITLLTVYVDPTIIHSPLHHRGGPFFFVLSLVPLLALFWWFRRQERRRKPEGKPS